jgi:hypothetical protein
MFFYSKKRENRIAFAYYAVSKYDSIKESESDILTHKSDDMIYLFFRNIINLNSPTNPQFLINNGKSLSSNLDHCFAYEIQGKDTIIGGWEFLDCYRKKYSDRACYLSYLCAITQSYNFADQDLPIQEEDKDFFIYCLKKLNLEEHENFTEHFCLRDVREAFAKILFFDIENLS